MRKINRVLVFKLLGITAVILVGVIWFAPRVRPVAQAQGIASPGLPLTTAYFYGPVSASANHMVKMCSNNLFGDGSVRLVAAVINAADGRVLVDQEMTLPQRGGECLTFQSKESVDVLGVLWSLGGSWGDFTWNSARASGPLASLQLVDVTSNQVVGIINTPGKVTVDSNLLPAVQR
jgi:hypothetical protein